MGIDTVVFIFGGILLLIGILGGGFELKELKIPQVSLVPRLLASIVGLAFIGVGIEMTGRVKPNEPGIPSQPPPIEFTVRDHLGENQVSEQVTIIIDGKPVGNLTVNEQYPYSEIRVTVPRNGKYSYTIDARAVFRSDEELIEYVGAGQGMINVAPQKSFDLQGTVSGETWLVVMVENDR